MVKKYLGSIYRSDRFQEGILLSSFIIPSLYIIYESFDISGQSAVFPRITAVGVIIFSLSIIFDEYIPDSLRPQGTSSPVSDTDSNEPIPEIEEVNSTQAKFPIIRENGGIFVSLLTIGYIVSGYLIGLLWVTPIFTFVYTYSRGLVWYKIIFLIALSSGIAYFFMVIGRIPISEGAITW